MAPISVALPVSNSVLNVFPFFFFLLFGYSHQTRTVEIKQEAHRKVLNKEINSPVLRCSSYSGLQIGHLSGEIAN